MTGEISNTTSQEGTDKQPGRPRPQHAPQSHFPVQDNCLLVGGQPLTRIAERAGDSAFYVYDRAVINDRVRELRTALPEAVELHYAMKANPMPEVVNYLAALTDGLDVASAGELAIALDSGTNPENISFARPGKSARDLAAAVESGVIIILESVREMERVAELARQHGLRPPVAVRVNPDFELKGSGMRMGGGAKPFGVDAEQVPDLLSQLSGLPLDYRGLHIFSGSQNLNPDALIEAHNQTFDLAGRLSEAGASQLRWLNIGGGLGVPYFPGEQPLQLDAVMDNLDRLSRAFTQRYPGVQLVMELGRYLVAEAGLYVCQVTDRKVSRGEAFLVTNGGLHHHLAASGNFGQIIRKNYPVCLGNRVHGEPGETVTIVGPLCTPLDLLAERMTLPVAEIGDLVVIFQSGAYGYTASPHRFLGHPPPQEFLV